MSCEYCGALMEQGSLLCMACGSERREAAPRPREPLRREVEVQVMGRTCDLHPGLPVLGNCPRCGKSVCYRCAPEALKDNFTCGDCFGMTSAHRTVPAGAICAVHPGTAATFICARCGSFACTHCRSFQGDAGYCTRCERNIGVKATRGSRFVANLVDNFLVILLPVLGFFIAASVSPRQGGEFNPLIFIFVAGAALLPCGAQLWAQIAWEQSIGKRMLGIKVVRLNGDPIELWRVILLRNVVVQVVAQACGLIGLIDALLIFGDEQRCLHDYIADSIVVVATDR